MIRLVTFGVAMVLGAVLWHAAAAPFSTPCGERRWAAVIALLPKPESLGCVLLASQIRYNRMKLGVLTWRGDAGGVAHVIRDLYGHYQEAEERQCVSIGVPSWYWELRAFNRPQVTGRDGRTRLGLAMNRDRYDAIILRAERESGVPFALIKAVIEAESGFEPDAVSPRGAQGLMQLIPQTASELNVTDPFDPEENIGAGARYLRYLLDRFNGNLPLALAAYNAGESRVARYQAIPPIPETREYVRNVLRFFSQGPVVGIAGTS